MRRTRKISKLPLVIGFIVVIITTFFILKIATGGKVSIIKNGTLHLSDNFTEEDKQLILSAVPETEKFSKDLNLDIALSNSRPSDEKEALFDIILPTVDFYDETSNISSEGFRTNIDSPAANAKISATSLFELSPEKKLVSLDGKYFLDDFEQGALYRVISIKDLNGETISDPETVEVLQKISQKLPELPMKDTTLSINQTGVTALTRKLQTKLDQTGNGAYFAENIADFLKNTDLTHISNEVSFADNCTTNSSTTTLCSDPRMFATVEAIGTDIVELTGNHNNDWSAAANINSIEKYQNSNMQTFGGGKDEESAKIPLEIDQKNTKITWVGVNNSTSTKANGQGASGNHPGANIYDEETVKSQISEAKERGDSVIVDIQYFECYSYPDGYAEMPSCDAPISGQQAFFRKMIDFGADLVVGTQAHQPQTFEIYEGKPIYYGLGNLFFDQTRWPGTTRSIVLTHYFNNGKLLQTRFSPTVYDSTFQTRLMDQPEAEAFYKRLVTSRP
ncbi:CapA family protein [Candidatus Saccharibacteria bacterium]|nr:CapA family protein [Candidatus Saccharibacteria bacterium]